MKSPIPVAVAALVLQGVPALAYDIPNHNDMSVEAANLSILKRDATTLPNLGLSDPNRKFPASAGENAPELVDGCWHGASFTIVDLIGCGAQFEDVPGSRSVNHFYDPVRNLPLTVLFSLGMKSPDWALKDNNDNSSQQFSYKDARQYFYKALTTAGPQKDRDAFWGKTFQSIGQVIHHVQDMAQPQHVRNDQHVDKWYLPGFYNPSAYERFTSDNRTNVRPYFAGAAPAYGQDNAGPFKMPRDFWINDSKSGLAETTNRNFVSAGTNFTVFGGAAVPNTTYRFPEPGAEGAPVPVTQLSPPVSQDVLTFCGTGPACSMSFFPTPANGNPRAAALSIFDQYVQLRPVTYTDPNGTPTGPSEIQVDRIPTLNKYTFVEAQKRLLPQAVSYSAGLINFFFRGKLEISAPDEGVYSIVDHSKIQQSDAINGFVGFDTIKLKVRNASDNKEAMGAGTIVAVAKFRRNGCYADDLSGEFLLDNTSYFPCANFHTKDEEIVVSREVSISTLDTATPQQFTFTFDKQIPINATDLYLQVVFKGKLGSEADGVAVGTKDVFEPTYLAFINNTDQILFNGNFYSTSDPALLPTLDGNHDGVIDSVFDKSPLKIFFGFNNTQFLGSASGVPPGRFIRVVLLTDKSSYLIRNAELGNAYTFPTNTFSLRPEFNQVKDGVYYLEGLRKIRGVPMFNDVLLYVSYPGLAYPTDDAIKAMPALTNPAPYPIDNLVFK